MTDREKGSEPQRERARPSSDEIIPERHGKHGGGEESEGSPQADAPEAPAPRERDSSNGTNQ